MTRHSWTPPKHYGSLWTMMSTAFFGDLSTVKPLKKTAVSMIEWWNISTGFRRMARLYMHSPIILFLAARRATPKWRASMVRLSDPSSHCRSALCSRFPLALPPRYTWKRSPQRTALPKLSRLISTILLRSPLSCLVFWVWRFLLVFLVCHGRSR